MPITVNIYYKGKNGVARNFAREMTQSGTVERFVVEDGLPESDEGFVRK